MPCDLAPSFVDGARPSSDIRLRPAGVPDQLFPAAFAPGQAPSSSRAMTMRWISDVPSKISKILMSRK